MSRDRLVDKVVQLRITIRGTDPPIWRRVVVPATLSLYRVHDVIQAVFNWLGYHLHQFEIADRVYGLTEIAGEDRGPGQQYSDRNTTLGAILERGVTRFIYRYDFGDDWEHIVEVERVDDPQDGVEYPVMMAGVRHAPPEDCGGPIGFEVFLEALGDEAHESHEALVDWYGGDFDQDDMELYIVEAMLGRIRASRRGGPAGVLEMMANSPAAASTFPPLFDRTTTSLAAANPHATRPAQSD